jgi:plastocyanin
VNRRAVTARVLGLACAFAFANACFADAGATGAVTGTVTIVPISAPLPDPSYAPKTKRPIEEADPPRAVVYRVRDDEAYPARAKAAGVAVSIVQHGYQFRPGIAAVRVGDKVSFPNQDDEFHNVFSYSPAKRFDLGRYRKDEASPSITFDAPGLVKIYCEIHKHMRAMLLVLDTPWFTTTDAEGRFDLEAIPPGNYRVRAFLPTEQTLEMPIVVNAGNAAHVALDEAKRVEVRPGS